MDKKYLAQVNIAKMKAPLDDVLMKEFVDFLSPINALAETSEGFIWRLTDENGQSSTYLSSPFEDEMIIINMSVWKDLPSLKSFVFNTVHSYFVRNGQKWFNRLNQPHVALWWIDEHHIPTVEEAVLKLKKISDNGSSSQAFMLKDAGKYSAS